MTTIVWDGETLAADKRAINGSVSFPVTKIFKRKGCLIGAAGDFDRIQEMVSWFDEGEIPEKFPSFGRSNEDFVGLLVIRPDKSVWKFERSPYPYRIESASHAIGSGSEYATAAIHLGCDARRSVEVAIALDAHSGIGVDCLKFGGES